MKVERRLVISRNHSDTMCMRPVSYTVDYNPLMRVSRAVSFSIELLVIRTSHNLVEIDSFSSGNFTVNNWCKKTGEEFFLCWEEITLLPQLKSASKVTSRYQIKMKFLAIIATLISGIAACKVVCDLD